MDFLRSRQDARSRFQPCGGGLVTRPGLLGTPGLVFFRNGKPRPRGRGFLFPPVAWRRWGLLLTTVCRPPGRGVSVGPLGEALIRLLPDGFKLLFAPPVALPAPVVMPLFRPPPVVVPREVPMVVPFMDEPVVVPLVAD